MNNAREYIVAGCKPWTKSIFNEKISAYPGNWHYADKPGDLERLLEKINSPRYIFFLHWSWKVPLETLTGHECVCFHMADVPYGKGGSPLQNLIVRGHHKTKVTALRMVEEFDAGPVYLKEDLCLEGGAEEIYIRATSLSADMIETIIHEEPEPIPQTGESVFFKRRTPKESEIDIHLSLLGLFDFIRMLDADGYPHAYLDYKGFRYSFTRASLYDQEIIADVKITKTP